jgi:hypothetical protein
LRYFFLLPEMEDRGQVIYFFSVRIPEVEIFFSSTGDTEIILIIHLAPYFQTGLPIMLHGLKFPGLQERRFDLTFEKINNKRFTGIIQEHGGTKKVVKIENHEGKVDAGEKYKQIKELNRYLIKSDDYFLHVTSEFKCRWKQLIDSEVLEELNAK